MPQQYRSARPQIHCTANIIGIAQFMLAVISFLWFPSFAKSTTVHEHPPILEGSSTKLSCSGTSKSTSRSINWSTTVPNGSQETIVSCYNDQEKCPIKEGYNVTYQSEGEKFTSFLTILSVNSKDRFKIIKCKIFDNITSWNMTNILLPPENVLCNATISNVTELRITCNTKRVHPRIFCDFSYINDSETTLQDTNVKYISDKVNSSEYVAASCVMEKNVCNGGRYRYKVRVYPDNSVKNDEKAVKEVELPELNFGSSPQSPYFTHQGKRIYGNSLDIKTTYPSDRFQCVVQEKVSLITVTCRFKNKTKLFNEEKREVHMLSFQLNHQTEKQELICECFVEFKNKCLLNTSFLIGDQRTTSKWQSVNKTELILYIAAGFVLLILFTLLLGTLLFLCRKWEYIYTYVYVNNSSHANHRRSQTNDSNVGIYADVSQLTTSRFPTTQSSFLNQRSQSVSESNNDIDRGQANLNENPLTTEFTPEWYPIENEFFAVSGINRDVTESFCNSQNLPKLVAHTAPKTSYLNLPQPKPRTNYNNLQHFPRTLPSLSSHCGLNAAVIQSTKSLCSTTQNPQPKRRCRQVHKSIDTTNRGHADLNHLNQNPPTTEYTPGWYSMENLYSPLDEIKTNTDYKNANIQTPASVAHAQSNNSYLNLPQHNSWQHQPLPPIPPFLPPREPEILERDTETSIGVENTKLEGISFCRTAPKACKKTDKTNCCCHPVTAFQCRCQSREANSNSGSKQAQLSSTLPKTCVTGFSPPGNGYLDLIPDLPPREPYNNEEKGYECQTFNVRQTEINDEDTCLQPVPLLPRREPLMDIGFDTLPFKATEVDRRRKKRGQRT